MSSNRSRTSYRKNQTVLQAVDSVNGKLKVKGNVLFQEPFGKVGPLLKEIVLVSNPYFHRFAALRTDGSGDRLLRQGQTFRVAALVSAERPRTTTLVGWLCDHSLDTEGGLGGVHSRRRDEGLMRSQDFSYSSYRSTANGQLHSANSLNLIEFS